MKKNLKIILVNTNLMKPLIAPIGLDYVAEAVEAAGFEPVLVDLALEDNPDGAIESAFRGENSLLVGVTVRNIDDCYMASGECFLPEIRSRIKKIRAATNSPILVGGVGYSIDPAAALEDIGADYGIRGDGETALIELARRLSTGEDVSSIPGLVFHSDGQIIENPPLPAKLNELMPRRRSFVNNLAYFKLGGQGSIETKRGCDGKCRYCADPVAKGRTVRLMPPAGVADEIEALLNQGVDVLHLCDSEFNLPPAHALEVCEELIRRKMGDKIRWYAYLAPAPFSRGLAESMLAAGCVGINFGADSTHPSILQSLGRNFTAEDIRTAVDECRRTGIKVMLDLLIGGPGETPETARHTIETVKDMNPDRVGISLGVRVFAETPLSEWTKSRKIELHRPGSHGREGLLYPVFYISPELGSKPEEVVGDFVQDDPRFFFADPRKKGRNYNYNDNQILVDAIARGYRGAYWDILRRLAEESTEK